MIPDVVLVLDVNCGGNMINKINMTSNCGTVVAFAAT